MEKRVNSRRAADDQSHHSSISELLRSQSVSQRHNTRVDASCKPVDYSGSRDRESNNVTPK